MVATPMDLTYCSPEIMNLGNLTYALLMPANTRIRTDCGTERRQYGNRITMLTARRPRKDGLHSKRVSATAMLGAIQQTWLSDGDEPMYVDISILPMHCDHRIVLV
jgi:hypothetical protein